MTDRWQFCWYSWRGPWLRFGAHRFEGGLGRIYAFRIMLGPLDIRKWRRMSEQTGVPEHMRERLERFKAGCTVCGAMSWRALPPHPLDDGATRYRCLECGNVFDVPVVVEGGK